MSQQNDNSAGTGLAVVVALLGCIALAFAIAFAFVAFLVTLACAYVWVTDTPIRFGQMNITPYEAKKFILRGCAGAMAVPAFALCAVVFFGAQIVPEAWQYLALAGYVGGSLGVDWLEGEMEAEAPAARSVQIIPQQTIEHQPERPALPAPSSYRSGSNEPAPGFRFASWDDEEELRR